MLASGTIVAGYRIDGVLGEGGMGIVYRATQLSLNRTVALKVLAAELFADETFRERFRREGHLQAAIDHPHIVTVYEAGETERRPLPRDAPGARSHAEGGDPGRHARRRTAPCGSSRRSPTRSMPRTRSA